MASAAWLKLTSPHAAGMDKHLDTEKRLTVNHSNSDIDNRKSHLNITIGCSTYKEALQAMRARVKEVDKLYPPLKRKKSDERVIAEMIEIKCPAEIVKKGYDAICDYFKGVYKLQQDFFSVENVHGGFAHFDEIHEYTDKDGEKKTSLPHIHTLVSCYCEWTEKDRKTGTTRMRKGINGKNFEKRPRYNRLNKALDEFCMQHYSITYTKGKGKKSGYGKTVEELKATEKLHAIKAKAKEKEAQRIREQQLFIQARTQREAEEKKSSELQGDISIQEQTLEKLKRKSRHYYNLAVKAKEEAEQAKSYAERIKGEIHTRYDEATRLVADIERIKTEYAQMKEDFKAFIDEEMPKIKSEETRTKLTNHINKQMSRFELTAELDEYVNSITNKHKNKSNDFTL